MVHEPSVDSRCPVLLLTGSLGSGKTTLLRHWLREAVLEHCALIINEVGEVEFDASRVGPEIIAAGVMSQQCVCCTGLPDLQETLERLFWDRLHRNVRRFDRVVIETTGVANPGPVVELLSKHPFLLQKYRLEAVISTCASTVVLPVWSDELALAQITHAHCLVLTKRDRCHQDQVNGLRAHLQGLAPQAVIVTSGLASHPPLAPLLQSQLASRSACQPVQHSPTADPVSKWAAKVMRRRTGGAQVRTWFETIDQPQDLNTMQQRAVSWINMAETQGLLRFKGFWLCKGPSSTAQPWEVQWTFGDDFAQLEPVVLHTNHDRWGVTFIAKPLRSG
jgi:G3E family GTPase